MTHPNPYDKPPRERRCARCNTTYPVTLRGSYCARCDRELAIEQWKEKPAVEWDGKYPITDYWEGVYLMREEDLHEYLYQEDLKLEDLCLASCIPNNGREFSIFEFLEDDLSVGQELSGEEEINKIVNDWIAARAPFSWSASNNRLCLESVKRQLTMSPEEKVPKKTAISGSAQPVFMDEPLFPEGIREQFDTDKWIPLISTPKSTDSEQEQRREEEDDEKKT